jgi:hypothetical protein
MPPAPPPSPPHPQARQLQEAGVRVVAAAVRHGAVRGPHLGSRPEGQVEARLARPRVAQQHRALQALAEEGGAKVHL